MDITPTQCAAARALLRWYVRDLWRASGVSSSAISDFESGKRNTQPETKAKISAALEAAGIQIREGGWLRLKAPPLVFSPVDDAGDVEQ